MSRTQIEKDIWYRYIPDTWANMEGYRTDIAASTLENPEIKRALFILEDTRGIIVSMADLRRILSSSPRRENGTVGPFNVNPHDSTIDGIRVTMEVKFPKSKTA
jgi:hypothetical protein